MPPPDTGRPMIPKTRLAPLSILLVLAGCSPGAPGQVSPSPVAAEEGLAPAVRPPAPSPTATPTGVIPSFEDVRIHEIVGAVSAGRIERDIRTLAGFGTRHTLSDTLSDTRGIGAARRWIHAEFQRISAACGGCLEVRYVSGVVPGGTDERIPRDVNVVNVVALLRGRSDPSRVVLLTSDIDSRVSDVNDFESDSPGANDNASGVAATLEAARVLSRYPTDATIVFAALSGEEQGLYGGEILAEHARDEGRSWPSTPVTRGGGSKPSSTTTWSAISPALRG